MSPRYQPLPIEQMEETAVENNADLREHFYNVRISVAETRKSMLRMFPGLTFSYTGKHDTNSYLINQSWRETGLQLSWNLFNILSAPAAMDLSEASEKLAEHKRMAVQMAVLAQVHLARQQYENAYRLFERSDAIWDVDQRIFEHSAHRESVQAQSKLERISSNTAAIVSLLRRYQSLAQVYTANGKLQATLGLEPRVEDLNAITLTNLVPLVDKAMREWNSVVLAAKTGDTADVAPAPAAAAPASLADAPTAAAANEAPVAERAPAASAAHESAPAGVRRYFLGSFKLPARGPALDWNIEPEQVAWVASAGEAEGVVNGRLLLGVPSQGRRTAVVEWSLSDAGGRPLGRASYAGEVSKPATDEDWRLLKQGALAALTKIRSAQ